MSPTTATARTLTAPRRAPVRHQAPKRAQLGVLSPSSRRRRLPELLAVVVVMVSLLGIVIAHAVLAQGQLELGQLSQEVGRAQAINRTTVLSVAQLETPSRIASAAGALHLVAPVQVLQLPSVPLDQVLPPLKIAPAAG